MMKRYKSVKDIDVKERAVLVRADFNVPLLSGRVSDDLKIRKTLPTIRYLLEQSARVVLCSHLGRPKGKVVEQLRLDPVAARLAGLLEDEVIKADECIGPEAASLVDAIQPGEVMMLENTRFDPGEENNDPVLAAELADMVDVFVNDAFASAHRAHASTVGVTEYLPAVAGLLMQREIDILDEIRSNPPEPYVAIIGGAKVSDKIDVIEALLPRIDHLVVGGAIANTFLKARDTGIGQSLFEEKSLQTAHRIMQMAGKKLLLPVDVVIARRSENAENTRTVYVRGIPEDWRIVDIGPDTIDMIIRLTSGARMVIWNGPLGITQISPFAKGTDTIAHILSQLKNAITVAGGADCVSRISHLGLEEGFSHVSTGGGAFLEFMAGRTLPAIDALEDQDKD